VASVKIFGAGSIGNHMAFACREKAWDVTIADRDLAALNRTKRDIYPSRYGRWDEEIRLLDAREFDRQEYDVVIVGTPPDSHIDLALSVLKTNPPRVLLIEKPLCGPDLVGLENLAEYSERTRTFVGVGYNHRLTENTRVATSLLSENVIGEPLTVSARMREHWGGHSARASVVVRTAKFLSWPRGAGRWRLCRTLPCH